MKRMLVGIAFWILKRTDGHLVPPMEVGKFFSQAGYIYKVKSVVIESEYGETKVKIVGTNEFFGGDVYGREE